MDIHMQLLKKGVKAKKKRLGGGGQVSPTQDFKLAINNNISQSDYNNHTHSTVAITIRDSNTGAFYASPSSGNIKWQSIPVEDFVATSIVGNSATITPITGTDGNGNVITLPLIPGDFTVDVTSDLDIIFEFGSQFSGGAARENMQLNIIDDPAGLVLNGDILITNQNTIAKRGGSIPFYRSHANRLRITSLASSTLGTILIEIKMIPHGGTGFNTSTTNTLADIQNGTATVKEAFYLAIKRS